VQAALPGMDFGRRIIATKISRECCAETLSYLFIHSLINFLVEAGATLVFHLFAFVFSIALFYLVIIEPQTRNDGQCI
jgi:hypothetical protein